jgi:hypothetical protein
MDAGFEAPVRFRRASGSAPAAPGTRGARAADPVGYLSTNDPLAALCVGSDSGLQLLTQAFAPVNVYSPDIMDPPAWGEPISHFIFQPVYVNGNPYEVVPGGMEVPTGAFSYNGVTYVFTSGAPTIPGTNNFPPSVGYLTSWQAPGSFPYPASRQIISRVDYSTNNGKTFDPGWVETTPPLGGHFVQVAPVVAPDGYLYLFGSGDYYKDQTYLARLPLSNLGSITRALKNTPGFQIWTTNNTGTPHWSASPPSDNAIAYATPLSFTDDSAADMGEHSVQYFSQLGLWLFMNWRPAPKGTWGGQVVVRTAPSPTGPWSTQPPLIDLANSVADQLEYCCGANGDGACDGDQITCCPNISADVPLCTHSYGLYAPYMYPYLSDVSEGRIEWNYNYTVYCYTQLTASVHYQISSFLPYNSTLMSYQISVPIDDCYHI